MNKNNNINKSIKLFLYNVVTTFEHSDNREMLVFLIG